MSVMMHHGLLGASNSGLHPLARRTLRIQFIEKYRTNENIPDVMNIEYLQANARFGSWIQVSSDTFDWTCDSDIWGGSGTKLNISGYSPDSAITNVILYYKYNVLAGDLTGVTNVQNLFNGGGLVNCTNLANTSSLTNTSSMFMCPTNSAVKQTVIHVDLFDTSNVTNMYRMFYYCVNLDSVPLFDTSSATDTTAMFQNCYNVASGALALYTQASTQTTPPFSHAVMFRNCGYNTVTGAAELAQIPSSWGGTGA